MFDVDYSELKKKWTPEQERCGLILKDGTILELENLHPDPVHFYEMNPEKYLDEAWAIWHCHPQTTGNLSVDDYLNFSTPPMNTFVHFIVDEKLVWRYVWEGGRLLVDDHDSLARLPEGPSPGTNPGGGAVRAGSGPISDPDPGASA